MHIYTKLSMDKTTPTLSGRNHLMAVPLSPRLVRSRSGSGPAAAAITTPERSSHRFSSSERFTNVSRSKSTSRTRTTNNEGSKPTNNRVQEKKSSRDDGFGKFLQRGVSPDNNVGASKRTTSSAKTPSAWALSPGRWSLNSPIGPQFPVEINGDSSRNNGSSSSVTNKVLKYFKQKKVSSVQEAEYHQFRILHNRLLQWRFINSRAELSMCNVKNITEMQLFSVWLRILMLRKITIQKRIELQKVKHVMKLYQILDGQLHLLTDWTQLERKNQESVARLTRKLSALSTIVPLTHSVKVDMESVYEALITSIKVMESMEPLTAKYQTQQVERILYQITELTTTLKQEEEYLQELVRLVPVTATLLENEKSIRVDLIQTTRKCNTSSNYLCSIAQ